MVYQNRESWRDFGLEYLRVISGAQAAVKSPGPGFFGCGSAVQHRDTSLSRLSRS